MSGSVIGNGGPTIHLEIVADADTLARRRADALLHAVAQTPDLVFLGNSGRTPRAMYRLLAESGADLSRLRLRMLDCWVLDPQSGFDALDHPAAFTGYLHEAWLDLIAERRRPRDIVLLPEDLTTCGAVAAALAAQRGAWSRPAHPINGTPGAEVVIDASAGGVLASVRDACARFDDVLRRDPPAIVSLGLGAMPYPHMAFNNGPFTRAEAGTHLTHTDEAVRAAEGATFGGPQRVPEFALTVGPATILHAARVWVTAQGTGKAASVAEIFADPRGPDHALRGSMAYVLRHPDVSLLLDRAAAASLLADGGLVGLVRRYREAGIRLLTAPPA